MDSDGSLNCFSPENRLLSTVLVIFLSRKSRSQLQLVSSIFFENAGEMHFIILRRKTEQEPITTHATHLLHHTALYCIEVYIHACEI
jgi:hypothetical protein